MKRLSSKFVTRFQILICVCFLSLILCSCVSRDKYLRLHEEMTLTKDRYEQGLEKIRDLEDANARLKKALSDTRLLYAYEKKVNSQMIARVRLLKQRLEQKDMVIHLQKEIITMLDDTQKSISSSLAKRLDSKEKNKKAGIDDWERLNTIVESLSFGPGCYDLDEKVKAKLLKISVFLRGLKDSEIIVAGHADNIPPGPGLKGRIVDNWVLSGIRAAVVASFLENKCGIDPDNLSIRAYSCHQPVAPNSTEEGRRKNRRVEIIVRPKTFF